MPLLPVLKLTALRQIESDWASATPSLMERAGAAAAEFALELLGTRSGPVLVVAGPGNNGGDGFVAARLLQAAGREVVMVFAADAAQLPADARAAHAAWLACGGQCVSDFVAGAWALAIDAIFGAGLNRAPEGRYAEWIGRLNTLDCPVLALDCPSGLDADTGVVPGIAVVASHTLSFIAAKPGLLTLDGPDLCGQLRVAALGLPPQQATGAILRREAFTAWLRPRRANSHKGDYGDAGVVGGGAGMCGAALLAARAALKLGAGRVFVGLLDRSAPALDYGQPELMLRPAGQIASLASAIAVGPGLGQEEAAQLLLRRLLAHPGPLLLDADALNLIGASPVLQDLCAQRVAPTLLTPHPAEAGRLLQCSTREVQADRVASACRLAERYQAEVVLKGCGSVLANPGGRWWINRSGHPGMATGGAGDVLAGLALALLAQAWPASAALQAAVHLHGCAGDHLADRGIGPVGLAAGELIDAARAVFNGWLRGPAGELA